MYKNILAFGIISLFFVSALAPMTFGEYIRTKDNESLVESYNFDSYHVTEISNYKQDIYKEATNHDNIESEETINPLAPTQPMDGPMNSPWPMYCHDVRHTGQSPYTTVNNHGTEKWKFWTELDGIPSGIIISDDGTIYFSGSYDLYAVHLNGTQKWRFDLSGVVLSCPAIDENGAIYVGTAHGDTKLWAINSDGTLKWKYPAQIFSSPAIGADGTIYFGDANNNINALYPNGTLRWRYTTGHVVYSSPAIGEDGIVYCGSHDTYLYALYPNNGTLKWKYGTGNWIRTSPCIDDDGVIYVVSLDYYLHAVNPDGTLKWKTNVGAGTSPTIGHDGTIYAGYRTLHAVDPVDGSVKWTFDVGSGDRCIRGATPCNSVDGTIYFGVSYGAGEVIALNPDGTEKWRKYIGGDVESAPAIGADGTVYIGSRLLNGGFLHAFGPLDPDAPSAPNINGPTNGNAGTEYDYTFTSTSALGKDVYYYVEWGDGAIEEWVGPYTSGQTTTLSHTWSSQGTYTIKARAKDTDNLWGPWNEFEVTMPRNKIVNRPFLNFLENHPNMFPILRQIIGL